MGTSSAFYYFDVSGEANVSMPEDRAACSTGSAELLTEHAADFSSPHFKTSSRRLNVSFDNDSGRF